jgi:hypothetical protein
MGFDTNRGNQVVQHRDECHRPNGQGDPALVGAMYSTIDSLSACPKY